MDDDWRIKQLEEETRHEKAMRELHAGHLDAHDRSFAAIKDTLETVRRRLEETSQIVKDLAIAQSRTEMALANLIDTIVREHSNGKPAK
jgi:hypothetical protein